MPYREAVKDSLSYAGSGLMSSGGALLAQGNPPNTQQGFVGLVIAVCGVMTLSLPHVFREIQARREREDRKLTEKIAAYERTIEELRRGSVEPQSVQIAAIGGELAAIRVELVRLGIIKASASTDTMPTLKPALLVEDEPEAARLMGQVLASLGYEVKVAATLSDAIPALLGTPIPAMVLLDLGLPDGDGLDVVKEARKNRLPCRFVVTTGHSDDARLDRVRSRLTSRDRLLVKPVDFTTLVAATMPPALEPDDDEITPLH